MSYPHQNRRRRSQATNERTKDFCGIRNANRRDSVFCSCTASQPASSFLPSPSFLRDGGWLMKLQRPHSQYVMCVGVGEGKILHLPNDSIDITSRCRNNLIYPRIRWANWKEELNALLCMSSLGVQKESGWKLPILHTIGQLRYYLVVQKRTWLPGLLGPAQD